MDLVKSHNRTLIPNLFPLFALDQKEKLPEGQQNSDSEAVLKCKIREDFIFLQISCVSENFARKSKPFFSLKSGPKGKRGEGQTKKFASILRRRESWLDLENG